MKREFLENIKVGDQPLSKEIIDTILGENERDVTEAVKPFADYDTIKEQLRTATDGLKAFDGVDVKDLQGQVAKLTQDLTDKEKAHQEQLEGMAFDGALKDAIVAAKGRDVKAVRAMLDVDTLRASKNRDADIRTALEQVKQEKSYLFETAETPPPYAFGTGTSGGTGSFSSSLDAIWAAAGVSRQ